MMTDRPIHHTKKWWAIMIYIAVVVTITLLLIGYQYARYGHL